MEDLPIGIFDMIVIALVVMSGLLAYFRGFIRELLSIAAWIGAVLAGFYGYGYLSNYLLNYIDEPAVADVTAGVGVGFVTLVVLSVVASKASSMVQDSHAGSVDRALGFLFGLLRGVLILSLVYLVATQWMKQKEEDMPGFVQESRSLLFARVGADIVMKVLPEEIRKKANLAAEEARKAEKAIEDAKKMTEMLSDTKSPGAGDKSGTEQPGYGEKDRQQFDSLMDKVE